MPDIPLFDDLLGALAAVDRLPISKKARRELKKMLREASTPDRRNPRRAEPAHREIIQTYMARYTRKTLSVMERGTKALMSLSDEEWDRLVEEANREADRE